MAILGTSGMLLIDSSARYCQYMTVSCKGYFLTTNFMSMTPMKIGFITTQPHIIKTYFPTAAEPFFIPTEPLFTPDDQLAVDTLRSNGFDVQGVLWGASPEEIASFDALIFRSPWDYKDTHDNKVRFLAWLSSLKNSNATILNPIDFIHWNIDKHYLRDLSSVGIAIVPTNYIEQGEVFNLTKHFENEGAFIAKPCISAGGDGLFCIQSLDEAQELQEQINIALKHNSYMIQPIIEDIKTNGEWSFIFIGNQYSHAIHKITAPDSIFVHAERGGGFVFNEIPSDHLIQFAKEVRKKILPVFNKKTGSSMVDTELLYLRIDVIDTQQGPVVIECEGVEPELFFRAHLPSTQLFSDAISYYSATLNTA